jgi:hypothetical protein
VSLGVIDVNRRRRRTDYWFDSEPVAPDSVRPYALLC